MRSTTRRGQSMRSTTEIDVNPLLDQLTEKLANPLATQLAPTGYHSDEDDDDLAGIKRVRFIIGKIGNEMKTFYVKIREIPQFKCILWQNIIQSVIIA